MAIQALPASGSTNWYGYMQDTDAAIRANQASLSYTKALDDFRAGTDPDWTNAFNAAVTWSSTNKTPVAIRASSTDYTVASPITVLGDTKLIGPHVPAWAPEATGARPAAVVRPAATGFPNNRGLFEIESTTSGGRSIMLSGFGLRGYSVGTGISGIVLPGITSRPELGLTLTDLDISKFSGHGLSGGGRVTFLRKVMIHECLGYGINQNLPWNDSRMQWVYCFYNKLGGLNIDANSQQLTVSQSRFERSGQTPGNVSVTTDPLWNANAPGIRIRSGASLSFVQVDTDANNGAGVDIRTETSTPTNKPTSITFLACHFVRDGQGAGNTTNTTSAGVVVQGFAQGTPELQRIQFSQCSVNYAVGSDDGSTSAVNPARALWIENTSYCGVFGGSFDGAVKQYYFGTSPDPATKNWQLYIINPQDEIMMLPNQWNDPPFTTAGMIRYDALNDVVQRHNGTAWTTV